ncbi:Hypothetical predicted protein, partial [Pelobates cultripes]
MITFTRLDHRPSGNAEMLFSKFGSSSLQHFVKDLSIAERRLYHNPSRFIMSVFGIFYLELYWSHPPFSGLPLEPLSLAGVLSYGEKQCGLHQS